MTPAGEFVEFMLSLQTMRTISSKQFCIAMYWAGKAGIKEAVKSGHQPNAASAGHYSRHLDPILGFKTHNQSLYETKVPGHNKAVLSRTTHVVPVFPVRGAISQDMHEET